MSHTALRVAVLMGGTSAERPVSLKSGRAVVEGLRQAGYDALPRDVKSEGLETLSDIRPDVAFIALHGAFGEDGTAQAILEDMRIPYTGSGPDASRIGMDKLATKSVFVRHAVPTPDYFVVRSGCRFDRLQRQLEEMGCPVVCKPAGGGSSLGVAIVREPAEFEQALALAWEHGETVIVERYVHGREFTVGILDGEPLPIIELQPDREFFDYEAKYADEKTQYIVPVSLLPTLYRTASDAALRAYRAIGCRHMARVDLIYGYDGTLNVLEVNTIPGFTPRSLLPMAAAQAGVDFPALCDRVVDAALRDARAQTQRRRMIA